MTATIRVATPQDAAAILDIYAPIVRETAISFELDPPTVPQMQQRIEETLLQWPWLVCDRQAEVLGYVYATRHRARAAYQWSVDVSVYIQAGMRRTGIGRALYTSLFELLALQQFHNCYAGITLPNPGSVGLHEALGFEPVGVYRRVGYKLASWHDVGWWQLVLPTEQSSPSPPIAFTTLVAHSDRWEIALQAGAHLLQI
ncbi:MAG: GCN5 family acetyltransferase [Candidatus Entotheonella factor]|uniref:GCN5 family acetyltransferase n=1 Tax=Entotheonella factor TaxID=1429438 RepID=W4L8K2_ENTF1|nr:MAG: GCN5 family acetyltransferase [Candidatus Entotheonella factor]